MSRFARRLLTQVNGEDKLEQAGVRLISLTEEFGDDANDRLMRGLFGVFKRSTPPTHPSSRGAIDAGHAQSGYFNGGPAPFGYQARTVVVEERKERRKLFIVEVAARRARAASKVTPPRITNGPTLLTGILKCNAPGCGAAMTIRTGKPGQYIYYACNAKLTGGAGRCETRAIRQDKLDGIVLSILTDRILQRDRLIELLHAVLEKSDTADAQRHQDLDRVRRKKAAAQTRRRRLPEPLEDGPMSPKDPLFAKRLTRHRQNVAQLDASARSLTLQLERGPRRISEQLRGGNLALRKAYVRLLIDTVRVDDHAIHIQGSKAALQSAVVRSGDTAISMVPGFDRKWCRLQDSNL